MKKFNIGLILGSLSGMSWGLNTVFIGIILTFSIFIPYSNNLIISSLTVAFLHDFWSACWFLLNLVRENKLKKLVELSKSKVGWIIVISSVFGGPVGMAGYLLAVKYIGPSYTASFSALYPALGTVLTGIILKEKINLRMKIGVVISGLGILLLSYAPIDLNLYPHYLLGMFFSFVCIFGWALECVLASYAMKYGSVDSRVAVTLRQIVSSIVYAVIIVFFLHGSNLLNSILRNYTMILIAAAALIGSISFLLCYETINLIGAPRGMSLNITYVVWTIIFERIFFHTQVNPKIIIASVIIISGIVLISGNPKEIFSRRVAQE